MAMSYTKMQKNPEWYDSCHKSSVRKQCVGLIGFSSFSRFHQGAYYSGTRLVLFRELFLMMSSQTAPLHPVFNQVGYSVALSMTFAAKLRITFQTSRMVFRFRFVSCLSICLSCPVFDIFKSWFFFSVRGFVLLFVLCLSHANRHLRRPSKWRHRQKYGRHRIASLR